MNRTIVFFLLTFFGIALSQAQLIEIQTKKIDSLFIDWTKSNHPGGAIGIM